MNELAESGLALDEAVGDTLLSAESREENEELDGVAVVSHNDELGLTLLDELGNVVKTELNNEGLGSLLGVSTTDLGLGFLLESGLLVLLGRRALDERLQALELSAHGVHLAAQARDLSHRLLDGGEVLTAEHEIIP